MSAGTRDCDGDVMGPLESLFAFWVAEGSKSSRSSLFPSVCSRFSRPSTRFSKASSTSVLGPLFLGTASAAGRQLKICEFAPTGAHSRDEHTVNTRAVEHLAGFAGRPCAVALDLEEEKPNVSKSM
jgi:hypothetical protein